MKLNPTQLNCRLVEPGLCSVCIPVKYLYSVQLFRLVQFCSDYIYESRIYMRLVHLSLMTVLSKCMIQ